MTKRLPDESLRDLKMRRESAAARLAERELAEHEGRFIDTEQARADVHAMIVVVRTRLLGVPSRLAQRDRTITRVQIDLVDDLIREALIELSEERALSRAVRQARQANREKETPE